MATGLRVEDRSGGAENFGRWKDRIILLFEEFELWDIVQSVVKSPTDLVQLEEFNKHNFKAKGIILDAIIDNLIPLV